MAECEGGCKTWVHIKCHNLQPGEDFYCDSCREDVQTSKAHPDADQAMDEPANLAGSKGSDADAVNIELIAGMVALVHTSVTRAK